MKSSCIPQSQVPGTSALFLDYLYHFDRVQSFYSANPFRLESYQAVARELDGSRPERTELVRVLTRQNEAFGGSDATLANVERLRNPETLAVVTGQQVGLFSGPVFTLYKALTAVRLAEWLTGQGLFSVPVFWLATEDHDLKEVAATATLDGSYELIALEDAGVRPAPQSSVGRVKLSPEVGRTLDRLEALLPPGDARDRLLEQLRACYAPGRSWGAAFGCFMARWFSRWGVVLVDALDDSLHALGAPVYTRAVREAAPLRQALVERSRDLVRSGYHAQVHIGEDSTLLFLEQEGNRVALRQDGESYAAGEGTRLRRSELEARLGKSPIDFTPNALLRPVVQDTLLPTVAYIAGPSELAYHGQVQALYSAFGRPQPVIFPRASFTVLDPRVERLLEKYRLKVEDVWQGEALLGRKIAAARPAGGWVERLDSAEQLLGRLLEELRGDLQAIDPTLVDAIRNTQEKTKYQLERLRAKISRAVLERDELLRRHEQQLLRFLTPASDLQERQVGGVYFLGHAGAEFLDQIHSQIQLHCSDHQVLYP